MGFRDNDDDDDDDDDGSGLLPSSNLTQLQKITIFNGKIHENL